MLTIYTLKASKRYHLNDPSHGSYQEYWLKVYPNPAIGYFITEYQTIKSKKPGTVLSIQITDMIGHELIRLIPDRNYNQLVIPTETLNPGLYIITLKANGKTVDQEKLIIKK